MGQARMRGTYEQRRANPIGDGWKLELNLGPFLIVPPQRLRTLCDICGRSVDAMGIAAHKRAKHEH